MHLAFLPHLAPIEASIFGVFGLELGSYSNNISFAKDAAIEHQYPTLKRKGLKVGVEHRTPILLGNRDMKVSIFQVYDTNQSSWAIAWRISAACGKEEP